MKRKFPCLLLAAIVLSGCPSCSLANFAKGVKTGFVERSCISAPAADQATYRVFAVSQGWHAGVIVQSAEARELAPLFREIVLAPFAEIGWGDTNFYMARGYSWRAGFQALFFSQGSALHVAGLPRPEELFHAAEVVGLTLSGEGFRALLDYVAGAAVRDDQGHGIPLGPSLYGAGHFYEARGNFSLSRTCNTWLAEALRAAGCDINPRLRRASTLMRRLKEELP